MLVRSHRICRAENDVARTSNCPPKDLLVHRFLDNTLQTVDAGALTVSLIYSYSRVLLLEYYAEYYMDYHANLVQHFHCSMEDHTIHKLGVMGRKYRDLRTFTHELSVFSRCFYKDVDGRTDIGLLLADARHLLELYDDAFLIYRTRIQDDGRLTSVVTADQQLEEARASIATSGSSHRLSRLAFLYLLLHFVCAMLGMNLSTFGQGTVSLAALIYLTLFFCTITYLPILIIWSGIFSYRGRQTCMVALGMARHSQTAGFWFICSFLSHPPGLSLSFLMQGFAQAYLETEREVYVQHRWKLADQHWMSDPWKRRIQSMYDALDKVEKKTGRDLTA